MNLPRFTVTSLPPYLVDSPASELQRLAVRLSWMAWLVSGASRLAAAYASEASQ